MHLPTDRTQIAPDGVHRHKVRAKLLRGDFNLRGYENHTEDTSESRMFRQLLEEFFMQQFVTQPTIHGAIPDLVLSDNRSLVTEVEMCEGIGNSDHNKVMFSNPFCSRV